MFKAKQIVENKFWILESENGDKVGTLSFKDNKATVNIQNKPETFASLDECLIKYDVKFTKKSIEQKEDTKNEVYGFPTSTEPFNALWYVEKKLPIYTKSEKSNSYHCAGYYIIRFNTGWVKSFCPKLLTLQRYDSNGPYKTRIEMMEQLRLANETA